MSARANFGCWLLVAYATIAHGPRPDKRADLAMPLGTWFRTGTMDGFEFLDEILSGRRRWYRPGMLGHKRGLWELRADVADYFAVRNKTRAVTEGHETRSKSSQR